MRTPHIVTGFVTLTLMFAAADCADAQRRRNVHELGRAFTMKTGQHTQVSDLELTFRSVEDNRCRAGEMCITAGDATITIEVEQGGRAAVVSLHTMADPKTIVWNGYTIQLAGLSGSLRTAIPLEKQYQAEILVTRWPEVARVRRCSRSPLWKLGITQARGAHDACPARVRGDCRFGWQYLRIAGSGPGGFD